MSPSPATSLRVLVVNAGSSSLKLRLLDGDDRVLASEDLPAVDVAGPEEITDALGRLTAASDIDAVGHRIVHGGRQFRGPVVIDEAVLGALEDLTDLAPLHQPKSLAALAAVRAELPGLPAVACFDTAFHAYLPPAAATYAVPRAWRQRYGVRRYGFHGLSHAYSVRRAPEMTGRGKVGLRLVSCHLGAGASLCAIRDGRSVDTTMGFTPLEGLVMATRSGSVDPGLLLWLEEHERLRPHQIATALEHESGLLALAGTSDMREIEDRLRGGDESARLAFDVFTHRMVTGIGAMAAAAGGIDVLTFTGGIGEHSPGVRRVAAERLGHLGIRIDTTANQEVDGDGDITAGQASVRTLVIAAREDLEIARETRQVLAGG